VSNPEFLLQYIDRLETNKGAWFPGERVVFRGKDLFTEVSKLGWLGILFHGVSERNFSASELEMLECMMMMGGSFPDPRLWNNRVAALAGSARSTTTLAIASGNAVTEAKVYGHQPIFKACVFVLEGFKEYEGGKSLEEIVYSKMKKDRCVPGYGRPITDIDERIEPVLNTAKKLGFADGKYLKFAFEVEEFLKNSRYKIGMNAAALFAAFSADLGLTPREFYMFSCLSFSGGMFPSYVDAIEKPEGSFFPLTCDRLTYNGQSKRIWCGGNR